MSINKFVVTFLTSVNVLFVVTTAHSATYYVAKTGSDFNSCSQAQNISTPKLTIFGGASCMASGDKLYVRGGTYTEPRNSVYVPAGTSWSSPTTVARYTNETVILQPNPLRTFNATLSYAVFDGFIFDGTGQGWNDGVAIGQGPHHLRFVNIELRNYGANGFHANGSDGNEFINCHVHDGGTTDFDNAFYIQGSNNLVEGCEIDHWAGAAVQIYNGGGPTLSNNIVRRNRIHDTSGGFRGSSNTDTGGYTNPKRTQGIIVQDAANSLVYNNLIHDLRNNGVPRYAIVASRFSTNTQIYNNTIFANPTEGIEVDSEVGTGTLIKNNLLYQNTLGNIVAGGSATYAANLGDVAGTGIAFVGNPSFVSLATRDAHLTAASPAVNVGVTLAAVTVDFDGTTRPQGVGPDIGAYEYNSTTAGPRPPTNLRIIQ